MWHSPEIIQIILWDLIRSTQSHPLQYQYPLENGDADLADDVGLSSIQIMELAAKVNAFFQLMAVEKTPYLLGDTKVSSWIEKILSVCYTHTVALGFASSGTGGQVRIYVQQVTNLMEEVFFLQTCFPVPDKIISLVPSHHIYGFLFTILLPFQWQIPCLAWGGETPGQITDQSLLIATPTHWQYLFDSYQTENIHFNGVSSGAPLDPVLYKKLQQRGWNITDVYGATETGGIGFRREPDKPFRLFSYWLWVEDEKGTICLQHLKNGSRRQIMDRIKICGDREFQVLGRKDGAVQVGGVNVYPDAIATTINSITGVEHCTIFAKAVSGNTKLFCSIYLLSDTTDAEQYCFQQMRLLLPSVAIPAAITFYQASKQDHAN